MKLYIASTILNIDNYLSTESIAPISFYQQRDYGYTHIYSLSVVPFQNVLILFSKIPSFVVEDADLDNRPMVIEVEIKEASTPLRPVGEKEGCRIYTCDSVLRLTPFDTRFLFFNDQDRVAAGLKSSSSLTYKLYDSYKLDLCSPAFSLKQSFFSGAGIVDECIDFQKKVKEDKNLDKVKGFIFGYYLGITKSVSAITAQLLKRQKRIDDIVAAMKGDGYSTGNGKFLEELEVLDKEITKLNPFVHKLDSLQNTIKAIRDSPEKDDEKRKNDIMEIEWLKSILCSKQQFYPYFPLSAYRINGYERYTSGLAKYVRQFVKADREFFASGFSADVFEINPAFETCMLLGKDVDFELFNQFINKMLWLGNTPNPEFLKTNRFDIATEIAKKAKEIWEETRQEWKESNAQKFLNGLRRNIQEFTPLDVESQENIILKSLAAYVLKGEDYEELVRFCENNTFTDYRFVLALWGATIGYVKIPRTIFDTLREEESFSEVYRQIYKQLFNQTLSGKLPLLQRRKIYAGRERNNDGDDNWKEIFRQMAESVASKQTKYEAMVSVQRVLSYFEEPEYERIMHELNDQEGWKTKTGKPNKPWKELKKKLNLMSDQSKGTENRQLTIKLKCSSNKDSSESSLKFEDDKESESLGKLISTEDSLLKERSWINNCISLIKDSKAQKQFMKDIQWFIDNHQKTVYSSKESGERRGYYYGKDPSNFAVIERLLNFMDKRKKGDEWYSAIYKEGLIPIEEIINYLKQRYV